MARLISVHVQKEVPCDSLFRVPTPQPRLELPL